MKIPNSFYYIIAMASILACGPDRKAIEQNLGKLKTERTSLRLHIQSLQDTITLINNTYHACYEAIRYQYGYRKYIEPHYLAYSDSIISSMDLGKARTDSIKGEILNFVRSWENFDVRIDATLQRYQNGQLPASDMLDSLSHFHQGISELQQRTAYYQHLLSDYWQRVRVSCGNYKKNMNSLIEYYRSRKIIP